MQISGVPYKFTYVWGANAVSPQFITTPVPATSASPAASQQLGFPPATANPSGTPPNINDFNGAFNYFSLWTQWVQAGSPVVWDSTFSTNNGGYPQSAILASALYPGVLWISLVDNNMTDPDTGGANWTQYPPHGEQYFSSSGTFTASIGVTWVYVEVYGGGSGGQGGTGGGGAGGGYASKWIAVIPGDTYSITVGAGGAAGTGSGAGNGGTSTAFGLSATGGTGATFAGGPGGSGSGGTVNLTGQGGVDLTDNGSGYSAGLVGNAVGGDCAGPLGGKGGNLNQSASGYAATSPGGGGGANSGGSLVAQAGAAGGVRIRW